MINRRVFYFFFQLIAEVTCYQKSNSIFQSDQLLKNVVRLVSLLLVSYSPAMEAEAVD